MGQRLRRITQAPAILAVVLLLALAWLGFRLLPFRWVSRWLGRPARAMALVPLVSADAAQQAMRARRLLAAAARRVPGVASCMPQAVVAGLLLRRQQVPHAVYLGIPRHAPMGTLPAHAWVLAGPVDVSGGQGFEDFVAVGCFVNGPGTEAL